MVLFFCLCMECISNNSSDSNSVATCDNGIQDGNETGIDYGGLCASCNSEISCDNGIQDGDETGIDCGGSCNACPTGTLYYISNAGDDENNGTSPETPWQTIGHVNAQTLSAGDAILFKRGDIWREQLVINQSGTSEVYITYSGYGTGRNPGFWDLKRRKAGQRSVKKQMSGVPARSLMHPMKGTRSAFKGATGWDENSHTPRTRYL